MKTKTTSRLISVFTIAFVIASILLLTGCGASPEKRYNLQEENDKQSDILQKNLEEGRIVKPVEVKLKDGRIVQCVVYESSVDCDFN